ncbi:MAG TPA: DUF420 domain-containing protein, partial [Planctomycetaceae bacterium]|nr:DUF420 domain-containing protein [Planctomycetaceae bacterium]
RLPACLFAEDRLEACPTYSSIDTYRSHAIKSRRSEDRSAYVIFPSTLMPTNGFLGYPTTFMLDFVVCALALVVPLLVWSLWLVKFRRQYALHKRLQISLGIILFLAVTAFEVDVQMVHGGWENIVAKQQLSPEALAEKISAVRPWLLVHLIFAVTTPLLWIATLVLALRRFASPPVPGKHSWLHKTLGWASAIDITLTSVTGLLFYYVAFMKL